MKIISDYPVLSFLAIFFVLLIMLSVTFESVSFIYRPVILVPISYAGYVILDLLGVTLLFSGPLGIPGFCEYQLPHCNLQVTFGCTGIYALFILVSAIAAFPMPVRSRMAGIAAAIPVFYAYSITRLVIMGLTGYWFPGLLTLVHSYLMEIVNVIFIMTLFILWIRYAGRHFKTI